MSYDKKMITLRSSDGEMFEVEEAVALESQTIKHMVEVDEGVNNVIIPLPNVTSHILAKVIEYCKKHVEAGTNGDKLKKHSLQGWDALFMNSVDQNVLYELILAAKYLNIKSLLDVTRQTVADMIKGKTPEHIRNTFDIKLTSLLRKKQIFFGGTNGDLSDIVIVEILI